MAQASGGFSSYPSYVGYYIDCWIAQTDSANNRTLVSANAYVYVTGSSAASSGGSGDLYINGSGFSGSVGYFNLGNGQSVGVTSGSVWVSHNSNGVLGSIGFSGSSSMSGLGSASASGTLSGFTDYDRKPSSPSIGVSRTTNSVVASLGTVSSPAGAATYYCQRSENSGTWGDTRTGQSITFSGLALGSTQQFRSYASNSDGTSGYTYSSTVSIPNVPTAPSSISATAPSALSTTISVGVATGNGASVSSYYVQASPDNGATWLSAQQMTNQSYTYTWLTPGATYKFRAYAVNEMGAGAYATTDSTFVPAGGKRWTGSAWQPTATAKRWTGTQWVDLTTAKRWTGTAWVDLT